MGLGGLKNKEEKNMNYKKIIISCSVIFAVLSILCTNAKYDNPIDKNGTNYAGDSAAADANGNGIADYYDNPSNFDKIAPVISFASNNDTVVIAKDDPGKTLAKDSVTATDNIDGNITGSISKTGSYFTSLCGTYTIIYSVSDNAGNSTSKTRVIIVDCDAPVLTMAGKTPDSITVGGTYTDPGCTATDNVTKSVTVQKSNRVNTAVEGVDSILYWAVDGVGNADTVVRLVVVFKTAVVDNTPPVITLKGSKDTTILVGSTFTDPGYTATDNIDGTITSKVVTSGTVNTAVAGIYTITYTVSDNAGNKATVTRKVTVKSEVTCTNDVTAPVITLTAPNPDTVKVGSTFTDPGYSAYDDCSGDLTDSVKITELFGKTLPVSTTSAGTYTLVYKVTDKAGNSSTSTRVVYVVGVSTDVTPPVINLSGSVKCTVGVGKAFTDPGYTASDDVDKIITSKVVRAFFNSSNVKVDSGAFTGTIGQYKVTYNVSDAAGNAATEVSRSITVKDTAIDTSIFSTYGVPLSTALPTLSSINYKTVTVDGSGPSVSTITNLQISWDLSRKALDAFALTYSASPYYTSFTSMTQTFSSTSPQFTISGTGISGLDGTYYINATSTECDWVKIDGTFAIVFKP
jgi:hypothetical protein